MTSDRPYEAILGAAEARGCDLIFIASHGRRGIKGLMLGSETQKLLQHTTIPVLVSAVESNLPAAEIRAPLAVIRDEHRSLAAVIHGLEYVVRQARDGRGGAVVPAAAGDAALHQGVPRDAPSPEGGRVPLPQASCAHARIRRDARRARAPARRGPRARRGARTEHRRLRGGSGRRVRPLRGGGGDVSRRRRASTWRSSPR